MDLIWSRKRDQRWIRSGVLVTKEHAVKRPGNLESSDATPWVTHPVGSSRNSDWSSASDWKFYTGSLWEFFSIYIVKVQLEFSVQTTHLKTLNQDQSEFLGHLWPLLQYQRMSLQYISHSIYFVSTQQNVTDLHIIQHTVQELMTRSQSIFFRFAWTCSAVHGTTVAGCDKYLLKIVTLHGERAVGT